MADRAAWTRYAGATLEAPRSKYRAIPQEVNGVRFDSRKEARRYKDLLLLERAGVILHLEIHPHYLLEVVALDGKSRGEVILCGRYTADFRYIDVERHTVVVEDVKSKATRTTAYRLRKRLIEAIHGVKITEV